MCGKDSERQMQDPCAGSIESWLSVQDLPLEILELPHNSAQALQLRSAEPAVKEGGCLFGGAVAIDSD